MQKSCLKSRAVAKVRHPLHIHRDLEILRHAGHAPSGARLILAHVDDYAKLDPRPKHPFVLAWVAGWQKTIRDYQTFSVKDRALESFNRMSRKNLPKTPDLARDFQRSAVYGWEAEHINKSNKNRYMSRTAIEALVLSVSREFGIEPPKVVFAQGKDLKRMKKKQTYAIYYPRDYKTRSHEILLRDRRISTVLHELAHAVNDEVNNDVLVGHSPAFIRTLLRLAEKHQPWVDHRKAEQGAFKAGLLVAPVEGLPCLSM